ncbi:hypothetical protein [Haladaptatus pallidirubidus]|nr:hypothetical protein [Haladaptatus pallidirubidus]
MLRRSARSRWGGTKSADHTMNAITHIRDSNEMLLVLLGAFALFGHDWLAATAGKTVAAVVGIALIVLAGIGIRDDIQDLLATEAPA